MWILFSILASIMFALVHVIDSYCVDDIYEKSWMGMIVSSLTSSVILFTAPFIIPLVDIQNEISLQIVGCCILAGVIIQINQALYFEALDHSDAAVVTAYWNMIPIFVLIVSFLIFGELLNANQYIGILLVIIFSVWLSLIDSKNKPNTNAFYLILVASLLQVVAIFLMDFAFSKTSFYLCFLFFTFGIVIAGLFPLLFSDIQIAVKKNFKKLNRFFRFFIYLELLNLAAYALLQAALKYGNPSLVSTFEAVIPANALLIAIIISRISKIKINPKIFQNKSKKLIIISGMVIGIYLASSDLGWFNNW